MAMVCPQCKTSYDQQVECPVCHVRLTYPETRQPVRSHLGVRAEEPWPQTPWGRLIGGILLAQGLYLGLVQACLALQQASGRVFLEDGDPSVASLVLRQVLQCFSLLLGGMLAGVGQRRGLVLGTVVGLWNTVFFFAFQFFSGKATLSVVLYAQPFLQTAFGAVGGLISSTIWKPPAVLTLPTSGPQAAPLLPGPSRSSYRPAAFAWGRIALGLAIALGGTLWANFILQFVLTHTLVETTRTQDWLVTWEISFLAIFVGAAVAGANTVESPSHGLIVGIGTSVVLLGVLFAGTLRQWDPPPMLILRALRVHRDLLTDPVFPALFTAIFTMLLALAGGWFGGQLFPPLENVPSRRRSSARAAVLHD